MVRVAMMNGQEQSQSRLEESYMYDAAPADATTLPPWTNRNYLFKGRRSDQPHSGVLVFIPSSDIPFHSPDCKVGRGYQVGAELGGGKVRGSPTKVLDWWKSQIESYRAC